MSPPLELARVARRFAIDGDLVDGAPYGSGHINDTFALTVRVAGGARRFILQRINHAIFKDPVSLVANIEAVTDHIRRRLEASGARDADRRALRLVPTREGASLLCDADRYWRAYAFIEGASSHDVVERPGVAFEAASAFGAFQRALSDYAGPPLAETIPHFHDTRRRYADFEGAVAADPRQRASSAAGEIEFARSRFRLAGRLMELRDAGAAPRRITHNDTKINNVLIDDASGEGLCVIDLDTVMDGIALFDFGDLVRTGAARAREDERDLRRVDLDLELFAAIARGYAETARSLLTRAETDQLVSSAQVMTYQQGLRFLTDHLQGDPYFKIRRPGQNLERARTQFRLLQRLEDRRDAMERIVERALS